MKHLWRFTTTAVLVSAILCGVGSCGNGVGTLIKRDSQIRQLEHEAQNIPEVTPKLRH